MFIWSWGTAAKGQTQIDPLQHRGLIDQEAVRAFTINILCTRCKTSLILMKPLHTELLDSIRDLFKWILAFFLRQSCLANCFRLSRRWQSLIGTSTRSDLTFTEQHLNLQLLFALTAFSFASVNWESIWSRWHIKKMPRNPPPRKGVREMGEGAGWVASWSLHSVLARAEAFVFLSTLTSEFSEAGYHPQGGSLR